MDADLILMTVLGIGLVFTPLALAVRLIKEWRAENRRLNRRIRELR